MSNTPIIEQVREMAFTDAGLDGEPDFYGAALELGCTDAQAEDLTVTLNLRIMRAAGMI